MAQNVDNSKGVRFFKSFIPAVCAAGAQALGHHACGMAQNMKKTKILIGILFIVTAMLLFSVILLKHSVLPPESPAPAAEEPVEISISMWDVADNLTDDQVQQDIEEKFNIKFVPVNVTYMNWTEEFLKMAAADELPDIICNDIIGSSTYNTWVQQELIQSIPSDLSAYPNLEKYMNQDYNDYFRGSDDQIYCIPRMTYTSEDMWPLDRCIMIRKDWLDRLGLDMPSSFEEFETMLSRFVTDDPDGNGLDDTSGLGIANMNMYEALYLSIFPELSNVERGWIKENNQWMPVYCSEKTGEALAYAKDIFDKHLLDFDFAYQGSEVARQNFAEGKCGAIASQYLSTAAVWEAEHPGEDITKSVAIMHPWPAPDGNTYRFTTSLHWSETYISSKVSEEKLDRILALYDYLLSDEFMSILETHPVSEYPSTEFFSKLVQWNQDMSYSGTGGYVGRISDTALDYANQELEWYRSNTIRVDYNWNVIFLNADYKNQLPSYKEIQNEMIKVLIGDQDTQTAWSDVLQNLRQKTTLNQAIDEVTKIADENGW